VPTAVIASNGLFWPLISRAARTPGSRSAPPFQYSPHYFIMPFMRIACPKCAAEYEVPASRLPPRKTVRCARCGGEWAAVEEAEGLSRKVAATLSEQELNRHAEVEEPLPQMTAMDRLAAAGLRPARSTRLVAAWILTLVILMATGAATIVWREPVVRAWPPSGRILGSADHMTPGLAQHPGNAVAPPSRSLKE
jgi:predicted Zn finger-like uncharacterized protein